MTYNHGNLSSEEINILKAVYNPNNVLITKDIIKSFLKMGGLNLEPKNMELWQKAFIHKSYCKNRKRNFIYDKVNKMTNSDDETEIKYDTDKIDLNDIIPMFENSNEKLEWLGDGLIQAITSYYLFGRFPNEDEGFYTKTRSKLVKTQTLSKLAKTLGFDKYIIMSRDVETINNGRNSAKILEDSIEAFIAVLSLDFGEEEGFSLCKKFFINIIEDNIDMVELITTDTNYKDQLMRYFQKEFKGKFPIYNEIDVSGNPNNRIFTIIVSDIFGKEIGRGTSNSKKSAEQISAHMALLHYGLTPGNC